MLLLSEFLLVGGLVALPCWGILERGLCWAQAAAAHRHLRNGSAISTAGLGLSFSLDRSSHTYTILHHSVPWLNSLIIDSAAFVPSYDGTFSSSSSSPHRSILRQLLQGKGSCLPTNPLTDSSINSHSVRFNLNSASRAIEWNKIEKEQNGTDEVVPLTDQSVSNKRDLESNRTNEKQ